MDDAPRHDPFTTDIWKDILICLYLHLGYLHVNMLLRVDLLAAQTSSSTLVTVIGSGGAGLSWRQLWKNH